MSFDSPIRSRDAALSEGDIQAHLDQLTKPPGSLGRLERLAARVCHIQGTLEPEVRPRRLTLFAADHGVTAAGVSAWPSEVTGLMIRNIATGGAASNALANASGTELEIVDVGSCSPPLPPTTGYFCRKIREGSRDLSQGPALEPEEWRAAFTLGAEHACVAAEEGQRVVATGEMGIGNTTPASCLASWLTGLPAEQAVGRGASAGDDALERKRRVVAEAVERTRERWGTEPEGEELEAGLAALGGLEIAAMSGFFTAAAEAGLLVVLDGVIASAAALAAERLKPGVRHNLVAAHRGTEPAHGVLLEALDLEPFLEWDLRLGEGTGALLLMPLLDSAAAMVRDMATFADLGITT